MIHISNHCEIREDELVFTASRSSGPGGQNVNKVSSRVSLEFDVDCSPSLTDAQRHLIHARLGTRLSKEGILRIVSQQTRSQPENKQLAVNRFTELLRQALKPLPVRRKTKRTRASHERRLEEKRRKGTIKRERSRPRLED